MFRELLSQAHIDYVYMADASKHCTFKIGGKLEYLICPKTDQEFLEVLKIMDNAGKSYKVIGFMSNILPADGVNKGIFITTKYISQTPKLSGNAVVASAGARLSEVVLLACRNGLSGMEGLIGIPATVGGAIFNNAGAFGYCISDTLQSIMVYSKGKVLNIPASDAMLAYRHSAFKTNGQIIISATFAFVKKDTQLIMADIKNYALQRAKKQPVAPSAGSVFKKHDLGPAGYFIEQAGLKGTIYNGAQISDKHANFIINLGGATSQSVKYLVNLACIKVAEKFNIKLTREIEYLGETDESTSRLSHT